MHADPRQSVALAWKLGGVLLLVVCLLARSWDMFTQIGLYVEDAVLFNYYYGHTRPLTVIFKSHIGQHYLTVIPDFLAWLIAWVDVRWQPWLYQWTGFFCAVLAASVFSFSNLLKTRLMVLLCPLVVGFVGLNHIYYFNTLIYVMYTSVIVLLALLLYPPPATRWSFAVQAVLVIVLPWGGPFSILALPAAFFLFFRSANTTKKTLCLLAFASAFVYALTVTGSNLRLHTLQHNWIYIRYLQVIIDKIFFIDYYQHVSMWYGVCILAAIGLCLFLLRTDGEYVTITVVIGAYICISLMLFFLSSKLLQYITPSLCHRVVAIVFWAVFLVYTADQLLARFDAGRGWSIGVAVVFLVLVVGDMLRHPEKRAVAPVPRVQEFIDTVYFYETGSLLEKKQAVCLGLPLLPGSVMTPRIVVGDRSTDARRLTRDDPEINQGQRFVCPPY